MSLKFMAMVVVKKKMKRMMTVGVCMVVGMNEGEEERIKES